MDGDNHFIDVVTDNFSVMGYYPTSVGNKESVVTFDTTFKKVKSTDKEMFKHMIKELIAEREGVDSMSVKITYCEEVF